MGKLGMGKLGKYGVVTLTAIAGLLSTGCAVAKATGKVAALPVKGVYYTGKYTAKGIAGTAKFAGESVIGTGKLAGKTIYYTGKGAYRTGETVVNVTNGALDTTSKVLLVTTQAVDLGGKVVTLSKEIKASELEATIGAAEASSNILEIFIDRLR